MKYTLVDKGIDSKDKIDSHPIFSTTLKYNYYVVLSYLALLINWVTVHDLIITLLIRQEHWFFNYTLWMVF